MQESKIVVTTTIPLSNSLVWEFYTKPEHIIGWNFASEDWCCPYASNDLKKGGSLLARMESKDGSMGFDFEGVYEEVEPLRKIIYWLGKTLGEGRKVEVIFEEKNQETKVEVIFDPENVYSHEQQRDGWQAILNNFKKYCVSKSSNL